MEAPDKPSKDSPDVIIEPAVPEDAVILRRIQLDTWYDTYPNARLGVTKEGLKNRQEGTRGERNADRVDFWRGQIATAGKDHAVFMARVSGRTVGYVVASLMSGQWRIAALYVLPEAQSRRVGSKLLQAALDWYGPDRDVYLHVAKYNDRAIAFYQRYGFNLTGLRFDDDAPAESNIPELEMLRPAKNQAVQAH